MCQRMPLDHGENSRIFFICCVYGAAFRGYSLLDTIAKVAADRLTYIISGKTEMIQNDPEHFCDIKGLLNFLSLVDPQAQGCQFSGQAGLKLKAENTGKHYEILKLGNTKIRKP